jgi:hypothetical protein
VVFPAILTTCSPWWKKPAASKDLALDPYVSTAGLENRLYEDWVRETGRGEQGLEPVLPSECLF